MENNNIYGNTYIPQQPANGYYPGPNPQAGQRPKNSQPLTDEQIKELMKSSTNVDFTISPREILVASCTHKFNDANGTSAIHQDVIKNPDGTETREMHCDICGATWNPVVFEDSEIDAWSKLGNDICETIKTSYLDADPDFIKEFFGSFEPMLKRMTMLWKAASNCIKRYYGAENGYTMYNGNRMNFGSGFGALQNITSNPYQFMPNGGYPQYPQQPVQNPYGGYGAPAYSQQPMGTPMAYGMPMQPQPQQPVQTAPAMNIPQAAPTAQPSTAPAVAPTSTTTTDEVQQTKTFTA